MNSRNPVAALLCAACMIGAGTARAQVAFPTTYIEADALQASFSDSTGGGETGIPAVNPYSYVVTSSLAFSTACDTPCSGGSTSVLLPVAAGQTQATFTQTSYSIQDQVSATDATYGGVQYDQLQASAQVLSGTASITLPGVSQPVLQVSETNVSSVANDTVNLSNGTVAAVGGTTNQGFTVTGSLLGTKTVNSGNGATADHVLYQANGVTIISNSEEPLLAQSCPQGGSVCTLSAIGTKSSGLEIRLVNASIGGSLISGTIKVANSIVASTPGAGSTYPGITGY